MTLPRSQADSAPEQNSKFSQQDDICQHAEPLSPRGLDGRLGHTLQKTNPDILPQNGQKNGTEKSRIEDHPEWRAYLDGRRILEPAIAAGAWIEYSDYYGRYCLVWHEKRRDGSRGARRRRFIDPPLVNGNKIGKSIWFSGEKTDEPFHYLGSIDELKQAIADAGCQLNIVEGEFDVWSMHALGFPNTVGIYGINNIPKDIASILDELGVTGFIYLADNDDAGERGASSLRTFLHGSGWAGVQEYRKFAGPGIPDKGDANDLLCLHLSDISQARAALAALPAFLPSIKRERVPKPSTEIGHYQQGWDAVYEAIRIALGVDRFKSNGYSRNNISCPNPQHEDKNPSAGWHKNGYCTCHTCGDTFNVRQVAEWLGIDWRALTRAQRSIISSKDINLDAAPQSDTGPLAFDNAPDTWLRTIIKFYPHTMAVLSYFALRLCRTGPLSQGFTRQEFINALRPLGCNISERSIYRVIEDVFEHDNHPLLAKLDPGEGSSVRNCKFQLRGLDDIRRRLRQGISYRIYEETFQKHRDTLIDFKVFTEGLPGSKLATTLKSVLEPLYAEQKSRFESLTYLCDQKIAAYRAELDNLHATPLPDWTIDKPNDLPVALARGIYDADPEDRSKTEWARLLGISKASVDATLKRAGIKRTPHIHKEEVGSKRDALDRARELGAKIVGVEVDGTHLPYDAAMDIPHGSVAIFQPPAQHEVFSDEKQIIKAPAAKPRVSPPEETTTKRADNMEQPGNWYKASWDPKFIYWELVKACCLLHGYEVRDGVGIYDPQTGEVWTNPTRHELVSLITGDLGDAEKAINQQPE